MAEHPDIHAERDEKAWDLFVSYVSADHMTDGGDAAKRAYRLADAFLAEVGPQHAALEAKQAEVASVAKKAAEDKDTPKAESEPTHYHGGKKVVK